MPMSLISTSGFFARSNVNASSADPIYAQQNAVQIGDGHPHNRLVERGPKPLLVRFEAFLERVY
jgi:hypothetical protein